MIKINCWNEIVKNIVNFIGNIVGKSKLPFQCKLKQQMKINSK